MDLQEQIKQVFNLQIDSAIEDLEQNHCFSFILDEDQKDIFRYAYLYGFGKCMDVFKDYIKEGLN